MDSEVASTPMSLISPRFKLIYHDDIIYEGWIGYRFTLMHKGVLVIT